MFGWDCAFEKKEESSGDGRSWLNPYTVSIERHSASAPTSAVLSPLAVHDDPYRCDIKKTWTASFVYIYISKMARPRIADDDITLFPLFNVFFLFFFFIMLRRSLGYCLIVAIGLRLVSRWTGRRTVGAAESYASLRRRSSPPASGGGGGKLLADCLTVAGVVLMAVTLATKTWTRNADWADRRTLFE